MMFKVLVIDDSLTVRAIIEQILEREPDLRVIASASDIPSARAMIAHHFPNVITLDLAMPGIDGMTFLSELSGSAHAPVLVVSSQTKPGSDAESDALALGAAGCFDKATLVGGGRKFAISLRKAARRTLPMLKPRVQRDLATEQPPGE